MTELEKTIARSASGEATASPLVAHRTHTFKPSSGFQGLNLYPGSALLGIDLESFRSQEGTFALLNLAMNAVEASAPGGTVVLRATCADVSVKIDLQNGNGSISESAVPRIFEPFFTTKVLGTGLGLAIAHNIARSHSGLLQLTDNSAARVRFTLTLPGVATGAVRTKA